MKNKNVIMAAAAGIIIAAAIISWLIFGGSAPVNIDKGKSDSVQVSASMKNTMLNREENGKKLWEFHVDEVIYDRTANTAHLKGIKGKVYRNDGSYIDIVADKGSAPIDKNDFSIEGKVEAVLNTGGRLLADKVTWNQKKELITAIGHVRIYKDEWTAVADKAQTTSAFKKMKLIGHAKVEKGGEANDKK